MCLVGTVCWDPPWWGDIQFAACNTCARMGLVMAWSYLPASGLRYRQWCSIDARKQSALWEQELDSIKWIGWRMEVYVPPNKCRYPYQRCIKKSKSESYSQVFALDSGFKTTGAKSVYVYEHWSLGLKVGEGWLGEPPWEGRELISDSKWPPGYQVSGEERGIMASIINEGRWSRTRKRKMVLPHTPGSLVQGQSRGRGGALWGGG